MNYEEGSDKTAISSEIENNLKQLKIANQKLARNSRAENVFESVQATRTEMNSNTDDTAKVEETIIFTKEVLESAASSIRTSVVLTVVTVAVCILTKFL